MIDTVVCSVPSLASTLRFSKETHETAILNELERVIQITFSQKLALASLLRYLVEETLHHGGHHLKEYILATTVFNKGGGFDPRLSSLVRTQVSKLRKDLIAHYRKHPNPDGPWLWIKPGSYRVIFDQDPAMMVHHGRPAVGVENTTALESGAIAQISLRLISRQGERRLLSRSVMGVLESSLAWGLGQHDALAGLAGDFPPGLLKGQSRMVVQQTILETNENLLITSGLWGDGMHSILYGASCVLPWNGDTDRVLPGLEAHFRAFVMQCLRLIR